MALSAGAGDVVLMQWGRRGRRRRRRSGGKKTGREDIMEGEWSDQERQLCERHSADPVATW